MKNTNKKPNFIKRLSKGWKIALSVILASCFILATFAIVDSIKNNNIIVEITNKPDQVIADPDESITLKIYVHYKDGTPCTNKTIQATVSSGYYGTDTVKTAAKGSRAGQANFTYFPAYVPYDPTVSLSDVTFTFFDYYSESILFVMRATASFTVKRVLGPEKRDYTDWQHIGLIGGN